MSKLNFKKPFHLYSKRKRDKRFHISLVSALYLNEYQISLILKLAAEKIQGTPIITVHKKPSRPLTQDAEVKESNHEEVTSNGTNAC